MRPSSSFTATVLVLTLLSGCAASGDDSASINVVPQNHSGAAHALRVQILDSAGESVFDKNYTLSATAHTGPSTKLELKPGAYSVKLDATRDDGMMAKPPATKSVTVGARSQQLAAIIETDGTLDARVS